MKTKCYSCGGSEYKKPCFTCESFVDSYPNCISEDCVTCPTCKDGTLYRKEIKMEVPGGYVVELYKTAYYIYKPNKCLRTVKRHPLPHNIGDIIKGCKKCAWTGKRVYHQSIKANPDASWGERHLTKLCPSCQGKTIKVIKLEVEACTKCGYFSDAKYCECGGKGTNLIVWGREV